MAHGEIVLDGVVVVRARSIRASCGRRGLGAACCARASRRASTGSARPGSGIWPSSARIRPGRRGGALASASQPGIFQIQSVLIREFPCSGRKGGDNSLRARKNSLLHRVGNFLANNWIRRCFREGFPGKTADSAKLPAFFRTTRESYGRSLNVGLPSLHFSTRLYTSSMRTMSSSPR